MKKAVVLMLCCMFVGCTDKDSTADRDSSPQAVNGSWTINGPRTLTLNNIVGSCGTIESSGFTDLGLGVSGTVTYAALADDLQFTFDLTYPDGTVVQLRGRFEGDAVSGTWYDNRGNLAGSPFTGARS